MLSNIEAQLGIYLKEEVYVILICRAFGPSFKIRAALKIRFSYAVCIYIHMLNVDRFNKDLSC